MLTNRILIIVLILLANGCGPKPTTPATPSSTNAPKAKPVVSEFALPAPDTLLERKVLYHPDNEIRGSLPAGFEKVEVLTQDGVRLMAWYCPPPATGHTLLYFHGNGGNLTSLQSLFESFQDADFGVFAIDYRGFGDSQGEPSEEGLYLDGLAAYDTIRSLDHGKGIIIFGRSLGGGVATYVAQNRQAQGLILESSFTSAKDVALFHHGQSGADAINAFDNRSRLKDVKIPTFLIHGSKDETIPSSMSDDLHLNLPGSELWIVEGAYHNNLRAIADREYQKRLKDFVQRRCQ